MTKTIINIVAIIILFFNLKAYSTPIDYLLESRDDAINFIQNSNENDKWNKLMRKFALELNNNPNQQAQVSGNSFGSEVKYNGRSFKITYNSITKEYELTGFKKSAKALKNQQESYHSKYLAYSDKSISKTKHKETAGHIVIIPGIGILGLDHSFAEVKDMNESTLWSRVKWVMLNGDPDLTTHFKPNIYKDNERPLILLKGFSKSNFVADEVVFFAGVRPLEDGYFDVLRTVWGGILYYKHGKLTEIWTDLQEYGSDNKILYGKQGYLFEGKPHLFEEGTDALEGRLIYLDYKTFERKEIKNYLNLYSVFINRENYRKIYGGSFFTFELSKVISGMSYYVPLKNGFYAKVDSDGNLLVPESALGYVPQTFGKADNYLAFNLVPFEQNGQILYTITDNQGNIKEKPLVFTDWEIVPIALDKTKSYGDYDKNFKTSHGTPFYYVDDVMLIQHYGTGKWQATLRFRYGMNQSNRYYEGLDGNIIYEGGSDGLLYPLTPISGLFDTKEEAFLTGQKVLEAAIKDYRQKTYYGMIDMKNESAITQRKEYEKKMELWYNGGVLPQSNPNFFGAFSKGTRSLNHNTHIPKERYDWSADRHRTRDQQIKAYNQWKLTHPNN